MFQYYSRKRDIRNWFSIFGLHHSINGTLNVSFIHLLSNVQTDKDDPGPAFQWDYMIEMAGQNHLCVEPALAKEKYE